MVLKHVAETYIQNALKEHWQIPLEMEIVPTGLWNVNETICPMIEWTILK